MVAFWSSSDADVRNRTEKSNNQKSLLISTRKGTDQQQLGDQSVVTGITYMLHLYSYSCGLYVSGNCGWKSTHVKSDKSTKVETTSDITVNNHLTWNVCKIFSVLTLEPNTPEWVPDTITLKHWLSVVHCSVLAAQAFLPALSLWRECNPSKTIWLQAQCYPIL